MDNESPNRRVFTNKSRVCDWDSNEDNQMFRFALDDLVITTVPDALISPPAQDFIPLFNS